MPPSPALIFDLDGTLVDTAPDLLEALNCVLVGHGRARIDPSTLRHMVGFGAASLIRQAFEANGEPISDAIMDATVDQFLSHYALHLADASRPFPGVVHTLTRLKADGARLGVLTNKVAALTAPLLEKLDLLSFFDVVYGAGKKTYTKPDPRIFHDLVEEMGGGPALMIGDSVTDLKTARAAGAPCILMSYGYTPDPVAGLGADLVLDDFAELPVAIRKLVPF